MTLRHLRSPGGRPGRVPPLPAATILLAATTIALHAIRSGLVESAEAAAGPDQLIAFGALTREALGDGEWYRLATAPLTHVNLTHLLGNLGPLLVAGAVYEQHARWPRAAAATFFVAGALGAFAGAHVTDASAVFAGASAGVFGLAVAALVLTLQSAAPARGLQLTALAVALAPSLLLGAANAFSVPHLVGAGAGAVVGRPLARSQAPGMPTWLVAAGCALLAWGAIDLSWAALRR